MVPPLVVLALIYCSTAASAGLLGCYLLSLEQELQSLRRRIERFTPRPRGARHPRGQYQPARRRPVPENLDIYEFCGVWPDVFLAVFDRIKDHITAPRERIGVVGRRIATVLGPTMRLASVLHVLREGGRYKSIANHRNIMVSASTLWRDVHHIVPILACSLDYIRMPADPVAAMFEQARMAIDCTAHQHDRVHPGQHILYRGDKGFHFIGAQIVVSLTGEIFRLELFLGHNNDKGAASLTGIKQFLLRKGWVCIADNGYDFPFVTPSDDHSAAWNHTLRSLRTVVETVFSLVKMFAWASVRVKGDMYFHALALYVLYQLTALRLQLLPLREPLDVYDVARK